MKLSVQIKRGIESLFGTRDENIRVLEKGLNVSASLMNDSLEIEGDEANVIRAASILEDYVALVKEGQSFTNRDLNSYGEIHFALGGARNSQCAIVQPLPAKQ